MIGAPEVGPDTSTGDYEVSNRIRKSTRSSKGDGEREKREKEGGVRE